ncbi:phage tail protein [Saccharopolyspora shandongensis]|uniref:phage tail protein n=1 Tax=Saccharopolyspora shandongensis TaxID=418495 RepID=UPI0033E13F7F
MAETSLLFNILGRDGASLVLRAIRREAEKTGDAFNSVGGSVGGDFAIAFDSLAASARLAATPVGAVSLAAVALASSAPAAAAAAGALGLAAFGAFAGLGAFALRENEQVKSAFTGMKDHVGRELTRLAAPLIPTFVGIAQTLRETFDAVAPSIGRIFEVMGPSLTKLAEGFGGLLEKVMPALAQLAEAAMPLIDEFGAALSGPIADGLVQFIGYVTQAMPAATAFFRDFFSVVGPILSGIGWLISDLAQSYSDLRADTESFIRGSIDAFVWMRDTVRSVWDSVVSWVSGAIDSIKGFFSGLVADVQALPGRILSALGNLGGLLVGAGRNLVQGLINGIGNMAGAVYNKLVGMVKGAWDGVLNFLGIHSPSREAIWAAEMIGAGLIKGLGNVNASVHAGATRLAQAAAPTPAMVGPRPTVAPSDALSKALAGMSFVIDESGGKVLARVVNRQNRSDGRR